MINIPYNSFAYRIVSLSGQLILNAAETLLAKFTGKGPAVFNASDFPWIPHIESNFHVILSELDAVLENYAAIPNFEDISREQERIVNKSKWKTYFLYAYGKKIEKNAAACPETTSLVEAIPGMTTAFFSILEPQTHIALHRGPYRGVLRYHMGLVIPKDPSMCYIKILDGKHHWLQGKSLVFDDTFLHEAHNESSEMRIVLFVDFKRKFPFPINLLNDIVIYLMKTSPFVANAVKNIERWERFPGNGRQP